MKRDKFSPQPSSQLEHQTCTFEMDESKALTIRLKGAIHGQKGPELIKILLEKIKKESPKTVVIDLETIDRCDDFGTLLLVRLKHMAEERKIPFSLIKTPDHLKPILDIIDFENRKSSPAIKRKKPPNPIIRLGEATIEQAYNVRFMVAFLGSVILCFMEAIKSPTKVRWGDLLIYMQKTGVDAVPIVGLISFLLGLIMAFVSSIQLQQFGAGIYVASLVALSMVSELGPIMTAIIVAGRSGSAYAAEIGTMRISEEIDALFTMGFSPTLFLVIPRIIAAMLVVPVLTLFSDLFAILGGLIVGISMLKLSINSYLIQTFESLTLFEFVWGAAKSVIFAGLIACVGCLRGFQVKGGAKGVGNAATSAVVSSIFLIILFDSIFAVIRSYW